MNHLKSLNKYFYKYKNQFIIGSICTIISNYLAILSPQFTGYVINKITVNTNSLNSNINTFPLQQIMNEIDKHNFSFKKFVIFSAVVLLVLAIFRGLFMFVMRQTIIVGSRYIEYDLKNEIYKKYQELDISFYKKNFTGDLMNRISEDVSKVRMYVGPSIMYIINMLVLTILSLYFMFKTNFILAIISISPLPILAIIIYKLNNKIQNKSIESQADLSLLTVSATETYSGIRVIQSFIQENYVFLKFKNIAEKYQNKKLDLAKLEAFYFPSMTLLIGISTIMTICIGGIMVIQKTINVAVLVEFIMYINMLIFPISSIGLIATMIQVANASQKRINEFIETPNNINVYNKNHFKPKINGEIIFKNVNFTYEHTGINAIKNFNLKVNTGEHIAILGKIASGKSTIAQLLLRCFDINSGNIIFNEYNINEIELNYLRNHINYVPQDSFVFSDTILNNLTITSETKVDIEKVIEATKIAELYNEIMNMPNSWNTILGERGINLSGGQKQRLAIARILISEKPIYIFDDSFSAIDLLTEKKILNNLKPILKNKTVIFITHRLPEEINFNKIVVLENGEIKN